MRTTVAALDVPMVTLLSGGAFLERPALHTLPAFSFVSLTWCQATNLYDCGLFGTGDFWLKAGSEDVRAGPVSIIRKHWACPHAWDEDASRIRESEVATIGGQPRTRRAAGAHVGQESAFNSLLVGLKIDRTDVCGDSST